MQREVGDHHVEQRRFPGARFAGDQRVLAGALAERQHLEFLRPAAADRHAEFLAGAVLPPFGFRRRDVRKRHLHAVRVDARLAEAVDQRRRQLTLRRRGKHGGIRPAGHPRDAEAGALRQQADARFFKGFC